MFSSVELSAALRDAARAPGGRASAPGLVQSQGPCTLITTIMPEPARLAARLPCPSSSRCLLLAQSFRSKGQAGSPLRPLALLSLHLCSLWHRPLSCTVKKGARGCFSHSARVVLGVFSWHH